MPDADEMRDSGGPWCVECGRDDYDILDAGMDAYHCRCRACGALFAIPYGDDGGPDA